MQIYIDGDYVAEDEARVSVFDHGYLYGDGVFEGIRAYNGRVFKLTEHVDRLYRSARAIRMEISETPEEIADTTVEACRRNGVEDGYIRIVVSRGPGDLGIDPENCPESTTVIIAAAIELFPEELYEEGVTVGTVATRRNLPAALNPRIKSLNYLNNILGRIEANDNGWDEGIMLNQQGYVAEGTGDNVFIIRDGELLTPPPWAGILPGITRKTVMELAAEQGMTVRETRLDRHDLYTADEFFLTGTAAEVVPVVKVDERPVGDGTPGETTAALRQRYHEYASSHGTVIVGSSGGV